MNVAVGTSLSIAFILLTLAVVLVPLLAIGLPVFITIRDRYRPGPRLLGVCWRLARAQRASVVAVRLLAVIGIILTGILPGIFVYLLLAVFYPGEPEDQPPRRAGEFQATAVRQPAPGPGRIGRYRITGTLGRGGMGTVYRGHDDTLDREVAVKVIHDRFGGAEHVLRRFGAEARAVAQLSSPHIVQVYEFDPFATPPFLAMELVRGPSVQELVRRRGQAAVGTVADCGRQVLSGLAAAHAAGVIHRDIKPANVLRGPDGTYKLTDFGLARSLEREQSLTASGSIIGTLHYMAPEVAAGEEATAASDLYSLGVTLYEMLAGTTPFPADSPLKLLRRIATESPAPIGAHRDDVPPAFEIWLETLLARDPDDRFASAAAALDALKRIDLGVPAADDFRFATAAAMGADPPQPVPALRPAVPRADVESIIRRATQLEAEGRDMLGHDTVLDIARELNVDSVFVREALRRHRDSLEMPAARPLATSSGGGVGMALVVVFAVLLVVMLMLMTVVRVW
jgi:phage shock protein PspC (stress-responsive transcriptional regulator)